MSHLAPPRDFFVGDAEASVEGTRVDFILPSECVSGAERLIAIRNGAPFVRLLRGTSGTVTQGDEEPIPLEDLVRTEAPLLGSPEIELGDASAIALSLGGLQFRIRFVELPERPARGLGFDLDALSYLGLTALSAGGLVASLAYFVPPLGLSDEEEIKKDRRLTLAQYLSAAAEREKEEVVSHETGPAADKAGATGSGSPGESGAVGKPTAIRQSARVAVQGPVDNPDPHMARARALQEMRDTGMIGLLNANSGDPNAPTVPFGRETSLGRDEMSGEGEMWGDTIADAFGHGGPGLSGIGDGGGMRGTMIGMREIGSIGGGNGDIPGGGFGNRHGRLQDGHGTRPPRVRMGPTSVRGRIPAEVIQRTVRQNFGRFRLCYEDGLRKNPNLEGRVAVRFLIGRDGRVISTTSGGSDLPDSGVTQCVLGAFYGLSFPAPDGGNVEVTYPILFSPE